MFAIENLANLNHTFYRFSYIKIPHTLCVTNDKLNGMHHYFH